MEIGVCREPSVPRRKRAGATGQAFFAVGNMSGPERKILRERSQSELVAVRGLLQKVAAALPPSSPSPSAPRGKDTTRRFLAAAEEPLPKRRKASPPPVVERREAPKKMMPAEREELAADLAELSTELPAHIVQLLQKQNHGCRGGKIVIDVHSMEGAALVGLKMQLEKFARERNPTPQDSKMVEEEEEEDVDICGGVSPLVIAPAPLQLAEEEDEYVDICGGASPAVMPKNLDEDDIRGSPGSGSDSDSDSSCSSSGRDCSDSDSEMDSSSESDESVSSPAPEPSSEVVANQRAPARPMSELIAAALEKQRQEERSRKRKKARQELVETERTAMGGTSSIHPMVLQRLGIAQDQYMVSH